MNKMGFEYTSKTKENFLHPKNMGEIENADGTGEVGSPACGDIMRIDLEIKNNKIIDIKFKTFGCAAAIASTSALTQITKGKTLPQAKKLTMKDVEKELGELPQIKKHCASMSVQALKKAIEDYEKKLSLPQIKV